MRIVLSCRVYPTHRPGGMPFVCQDRAEELARMGHDVHVVTTGHPNGNGLDVVKDVEIHYAKSPPMVYSDEYAAACERLCRKLSPDVIHLDSFDRARPWWIERPGNPKSVACTMHGFAMGAFLTDLNEERLLRNSIHCDLSIHRETFDEIKHLSSFDRVFAISLHEQTLLEDCYSLTNVKLLYNPIPRYFFDRPIANLPDTRRFLCAAVSGHSTRMFESAKRAADSFGAELIVASDVPRTKMPELYDSATALIVPTLYAQGYDLTVAEALARDRSVILSQTGSYYRECRAAGEWPGAMVPCGDERAIAEAMQGCLARPSEIPGGRELALRHHPRRHAERWLEEVGS